MASGALKVYEGADRDHLVEAGICRWCKHSIRRYGHRDGLAGNRSIVNNELRDISSRNIGGDVQSQCSGYSALPCFAARVGV